LKRFVSSLVVVFALPLSAVSQEPASDAAAARPIRALYVTGGCCHDYDVQKDLIPKGIAARAKVEWKVVHQGGTSRDAMIELYKDPDWADGFDVVVHNECFGAVVDADFVENIVRPHRDGGVPAVTIHCSTHSYRVVATDEWRKLLGVSSYSHESHHAFEVVNLKADHPVMIGFPEKWQTPAGELYKISKVWEHTTPLGQAFGEDTQMDHVCVWVNQYGKARVFGTTIGHHNETIETGVYLDLLTRGLLWSVDKLGDDGKPKP
jgi:type 1 glutamine amidotransferase